MHRRDARSKRERTRTQLVDAALRLYGRVGDSSLSEVAMEASMASGTIYNYYDSKEQMLLAVRERLSSDIGERIFERARGITDAATRIAIGCLAFFDETRKDALWAQACLRLLTDRDRSPERFEREVVADLRTGIAAGRFRVPSEDVAIVLVGGAVTAGMGHILNSRGRLDDEAVVLTILRGLGLSDREAMRVLETARTTGNT